MRMMSKEDFAERNAAIRAGRMKDREYRGYISDTVKRMRGKPKDPFMKHNAAVYRMGGSK